MSIASLSLTRKVFKYCSLTSQSVLGKGVSKSSLSGQTANNHSQASQGNMQCAVSDPKGLVDCTGTEMGTHTHISSPLSKVDLKYMSQMGSYNGTRRKMVSCYSHSPYTHFKCLHNESTILWWDRIWHQNKCTLKWLLDLASDYIS